MTKPLSNKTKFNRAISFFLLVLSGTSILNLFTFLNSAKGNIKSSITSNNSEVKTRVLDGDTIGIVSETKIRFACLDAIEKRQELGDKSIAYLKGILATTEKLSYHYYGTDNFGRTIAEIYIKNDEVNSFINVNLLMIEQGYAVVEDSYGDCRKMNDYYKAEKEAKENQRGIWAKDKVCLPSDYRKKTCNF